LGASLAAGLALVVLAAGAGPDPDPILTCPSAMS